MKDSHKTLYDEIYGALVRATVYLDILLDAPNERLKAHMLRTTLCFVLDEIDDWEETQRHRDLQPQEKAL
jgi:hypothetical protein